MPTLQKKYFPMLGVLLLFIIIILTCGKSAEGNMQDIITKLTKVANFWLYVEIDTAGIPGDTWGFMEVTEKTDTIKGELANKIDISYNFYNSAFHDTFNLWVINNDSLIYVYGAWPDQPWEDPVIQVVIPIELEEGKTWTYFYPPDDTVAHPDTITLKVLAKENISTPAGTFKECIKVEYIGTTEPIHAFIWFHPDVGIIKYYRIDQNASVALFEYDLK